jgi:hypothetical protein
MPGPGSTELKNKSKKSGRNYMELDDFKKKRPDEAVSASSGDEGLGKKADNLIGLFNAYQVKQRRKSVAIVALEAFLGALYLSFILKRTGLEALGFLLIGAGLAAGALYLYLRYRTFSPESYSLPIREFLGRALRKTSYYNISDYLVIIPLLLVIGTGGGMVFTTRLLKYTDNIMLLILIWSLFFISVCIFGFFAGKKNWKKEHEPLNKKITEMMNNFNSE